MREDARRVLPGATAAGSATGSLARATPRGTAALRLCLFNEDGPVGDVRWTARAGRERRVAEASEGEAALLEGLEVGMDWSLSCRDLAFLMTHELGVVRGLAEGEVREQSFYLGEGTRLLLRARDRAGRPASGVRLHLQRARPRADPGTSLRRSGISSPASFELLTDGAGLAELEFLGHGAWWVGASASVAPFGADDAAWLPLEERIELSPGVRVHEVEVTLERGQPLAGRVLGYSGEPRVVRAWGLGELEWWEEVPVAEDGAFRFERLPHGSYGLELERGFHGWSWDQREIGSGATRGRAGDLDVELVELHEPGAGALHGRVLGPEGDAVVGALVWIDRHEAGEAVLGRELFTDAAGRFSLPDAEPGRYRLFVRAPGDDGAGWAAVRVFSKEDRGPLDVGTLRLHPTRSVQVDLRACGGPGRLRVYFAGEIVSDLQRTTAEVHDLALPLGEVLLRWSDGEREVERFVSTGPGSSPLVVELSPSD